MQEVVARSEGPPTACLPHCTAQAREGGVTQQICCIITPGPTCMHACIHLCVTPSPAAPCRGSAVHQRGWGRAQNHGPACASSPGASDLQAATTQPGNHSRSATERLPPAVPANNGAVGRQPPAGPVDSLYCLPCHLPASDGMCIGFVVSTDCPPGCVRTARHQHSGNHSLTH